MHPSETFYYQHSTGSDEVQAATDEKVHRRSNHIYQKNGQRHQSKSNRYSSASSSTSEHRGPSNRDSDLSSSNHLPTKSFGDDIFSVNCQPLQYGSEYSINSTGKRPVLQIQRIEKPDLIISSNSDKSPIAQRSHMSVANSDTSAKSNSGLPVGHTSGRFSLPFPLLVPPLPPGTNLLSNITPMLTNPHHNWNAGNTGTINNNSSNSVPNSNNTNSGIMKNNPPDDYTMLQLRKPNTDNYATSKLPDNPQNLRINLPLPAITLPCAPVPAGMGNHISQNGDRNHRHDEEKDGNTDNNVNNCNSNNNNSNNNNKNNISSSGSNNFTNNTKNNTTNHHNTKTNTINDTNIGESPERCNPQHSSLLSVDAPSHHHNRSSQPIYMSRSSLMMPTLFPMPPDPSRMGSWDTSGIPYGSATLGSAAKKAAKAKHKIHQQQVKEHQQQQQQLMNAANQLNRNHTFSMSSHNRSKSMEQLSSQQPALPFMGYPPNGNAPRIFLTPLPLPPLPFAVGPMPGLAHQQFPKMPTGSVGNLVSSSSISHRFGKGRLGSSENCANNSIYSLAASAFDSATNQELVRFGSMGYLPRQFAANTEAAFTTHCLDPNPRLSPPIMDARTNHNDNGQGFTERVARQSCTDGGNQPTANGDAPVANNNNNSNSSNFRGDTDWTTRNRGQYQYGPLISSPSDSSNPESPSGSHSGRSSSGETNSTRTSGEISTNCSGDRGVSDTKSAAVAAKSQQANARAKTLHIEAITIDVDDCTYISSKSTQKCSRNEGRDKKRTHTNQTGSIGNKTGDIHLKSVEMYPERGCCCCASKSSAVRWCACLWITVIVVLITTVLVLVYGLNQFILTL